jgi:hypothetical protein
MKKTRILLLGLILVGAAVTQATVFDVPDGAWHDASNWNGGKMPGTGDVAQLGYVYGNYGHTPNATARIYPGDDLKCQEVWLGQYPISETIEGHIVMTGGKLTTIGSIMCGRDTTGSFLQSGGEVDAAQLNIAVTDLGSGLYEISGDSILKIGVQFYNGQYNTFLPGVFRIIGSHCTIDGSVGCNYWQNSNSTLQVVLDAGGIAPIRVFSGGGVYGDVAVDALPDFAGLVGSEYTVLTTTSGTFDGAG